MSSRPLSQFIAPERMFTTVDLPAPLGPINAVICPSGTSKVAPLTACTPWNALVTPSQRSAAFRRVASVRSSTPLSLMRGHRDRQVGLRVTTGGHAEARRPPQARGNDALGPEPEHQHQDDADDGVVEVLDQTGMARNLRQERRQVDEER